MHIPCNMCTCTTLYSLATTHYSVLTTRGAGTPGEWDLLITGHSLGGALASLISPELVDKVDTSRGFKDRGDQSWWGQAIKCSGRVINYSVRAIK